MDQDEPNSLTDKPKPTVDSPINKRSRLRLIILVGLTILALMGVGLLGWLYYEVRQDNQAQRKVIDQLRRQIRDLGITPVDVSPEKPAQPAANCTGGANYTATIGKFKVKLSDPNVIVRTLDANFEGGPITQLSIGRCLAGNTNVVDQYPTNKVEITGHPTSSSASLRSNFEANWGSPLTAGPSITIAGTTAQTYTGSGLFDTKLIYFDRGGIGYQIELTDSNSASEAILSDLIADWSFTP